MSGVGDVLGKGRVPGTVPYARPASLLAAALVLLLVTWDDAQPVGWRGVVLLVVTLGLAARSLLLGVWVRPEGVVIRDWFRTVRTRVEDVVDVSLVGYSGTFMRGARSSVLFSVTIRARGAGRVTLYASVAPRRAARRVRDRLRGELGLAVEAPEVSPGAGAA